MSETCIGIDIGGSSIKSALIDGRGEIAAFSKSRTSVESGREAVFEQVVALIGGMDAKALELGLTATAVGIGSPGFVDDDGVVVGGAPNLPDWRDFLLVARIGARVDMKVYASNDVNLAAYGECLAGSGRGAKNMAFFSFGTGIGGGLILDGKLYTGHRGMGAEFGHICVEPKGLKCGCGRNGCLEAYASAVGLVHYAQAMCRGHAMDTPFKSAVEAGAKDLSPEAIFEYIRNGDPIALNLFDGVCDYIARALGITANALAPDLIILGGGIMNSGDRVLEEVRRKFPESCGDLIAKTCKLGRPMLGDKSGVIGAGLYAHSRFALKA